MVTGRKLFAGEDLTETLASVVKEKADLSAAPPELRPLLEKCLEKDPRKRLRDISGVALLLDRNNAVSRYAEQRAAAPSRRLVWGLGAIAALAISVAAVFAALWLRPSPLPKVTRFEVHAPAGSTLPYGTPAISRDGRTLAYTETDSKGVTRIHLRPMDRVETRVLPGTEDAMHPFWSPDGQSLAFATLNMLKRIDIEGGSPHDLTRVSGPWHGDWNQFGEILFQAQNSIQRMSAQGSPPIQVQRGGFPVFLADGKRFLFRFDDKPGSSIRMATLDSPNSTPVVEGPFSAPLLAQAPNGKTYLMYLRPPDLFVQEFDEVSGVVRGQPKVLVRNIGVVANPLIRPAVGVSPSGILAYQTGRNTSNGQLQWIDRSGKKVGALSRENSGRFQSISPDGSHIAIEKPDADGAPQIWITDLTRGSSTRISFGTGNNYRPVWSPDGKRVAYQVDREGKSRTYVMNADGSGAEQVLLEVRDLTSWSPDGTYFLTSQNGQMELVSGDGKSKAVPVGTRTGQSNLGQFSPDGKYIAFTSDASGNPEVYLQPLPPATGQIKVSVNGGRSPHWRRDGKELFFVSAENDMMAVDVNLTSAVSTSVPHALFRYTDVLPSEYAVRPDGQQFLVLDFQGSGADAPIIVVLNWWVEMEK
jgi:Tol biopolymer transport system component